MAFQPIDRDTDYLLPPSVQEWLPKSHLARYVVDVVEGLDLSLELDPVDQIDRHGNVVLAEEVQERVL